MTTEKIAQPGPMEQWVRANWQHVDEDAPALIFAREQDAEHDRLIEQNAALLAVLIELSASMNKSGIGFAAVPSELRQRVRAVIRKAAS